MHIRRQCEGRGVLTHAVTGVPKFLPPCGCVTVHRDLGFHAQGQHTKAGRWMAGRERGKSRKSCVQVTLPGLKATSIPFFSLQGGWKNMGEQFPNSYSWLWREGTRSREWLFSGLGTSRLMGPLIDGTIDTQKGIQKAREWQLQTPRCTSVGLVLRIAHENYRTGFAKTCSHSISQALWE